MRGIYYDIIYQFIYYLLRSYPDCVINGLDCMDYYMNSLLSHIICPAASPRRHRRERGDSACRQRHERRPAIYVYVYIYIYIYIYTDM